MSDIVTGMVTKPARIHSSHKGRFYLKAHWRASGLTRDQIAGRLGVTPQHVSRMVSNADEEGQNPTKHIYHLAEIFGVTVDELRLPPRPKNQPKPRSADELIKDEPEEVKEKVFQMIEIITGRRGA